MPRVGDWRLLTQLAPIQIERAHATLRHAPWLCPSSELCLNYQTSKHLLLSNTPEISKISPSLQRSISSITSPSQVELLFPIPPSKWDPVPRDRLKQIGIALISPDYLHFAQTVRYDIAVASPHFPLSSSCFLKIHIASPEGTFCLSLSQDGCHSITFVVAALFCQRSCR